MEKSRVDLSEVRTQLKIKSCFLSNNHSRRLLWCLESSVCCWIHYRRNPAPAGMALYKDWLFEGSRRRKENITTINWNCWGDNVQLLFNIEKVVSVLQVNMLLSQVQPQVDQITLKLESSILLNMSLLSKH